MIDLSTRSRTFNKQHQATEEQSKTVMNDPTWQPEPPEADGWYVVRERNRFFNAPQLVKLSTTRDSHRLIEGQGSPMYLLEHLRRFWWWPVPIDLPPLPDSIQGGE